MKPIMLATDGSPSAEAATREAIDLAHRLQLPLLVVSVKHETTPAYGYYGYAQIAEELRQVEHARIGEVLAAIEERAAAAGVACETLELDGLAGKRICTVAAEHDARLLVVGAHGWGRIGRLLHGSVSTYVLHHAAMPVLVVHGEDEAVAEAPEPEATTTVS